MSDFDKEAEREKLREKYERDKADREATERMSDLLLKGATMTNTHCGVCGDPLFRQNGTTFCPSCHGGPDAVEGPVPGNQAQGGADGDTRQQPEVGGEQMDADGEPAPADDEPDSADGEPTDPIGDAPDAGSSAASETHTPSRSLGGSDSREDGSASTPPTDVGSAAPDRSRSPDSDKFPVSGDLENARTNLERALDRFSQEAAETDDPRYAKECLEAAREAAEALSALR